MTGLKANQAKTSPENGTLSFERERHFDTILPLGIFYQKFKLLQLISYAAN